MNAQTSENEFVSAFKHPLLWLPKSPDFNPFSLFNPYRLIVYEINRRKMNKFLGKVMDERFATAYRNTPERNEKSGRRQPRPVIDLALDAYMKEFGTNAAQAGKIDPAFRAAMMDHIKVFLFAGHDTTRYFQRIQARPVNIRLLTQAVPQYATLPTLYHTTLRLMPRP